MNAEQKVPPSHHVIDPTIQSARAFHMKDRNKSLVQPERILFTRHVRERVET